jgi:MFS family permease
MLGILGGMLAAGFLPREWPWNVSLLVASTPQFAALLLLPALRRAIPREARTGERRPLFSRSAGEATSGSSSTGAGPSRLTLLAFVAGILLAVAWSSVGQFILPLRASREFGLDRNGVATLLAIPQLVDALVLLPLGALADRSSRARVLGGVLIVLAVGVGAVAFGPIPLVIVGCVLFGVGLASWMLPVALLNRDGSARFVAWRTALYRVGVDAGVFLGPLVAGLLADHALLWAMGAGVMAALLAASAALLRSEPRRA